VENRCKSLNGQEVAAYASNTDSGPKITFCSPFWQYKNLDDKKSELDGNPGWQKNIGNFKTQGQIFLHEMTHLLVISKERKSKFDRIHLNHIFVKLWEVSWHILILAVIDYKWPEGSARAYGPKLCEKLARQSDRQGTWDAIENADNYGKLPCTLCKRYAAG
jgi:hypothetical protein